ncbi:hypothetical protein GQ53DRAFT_684814 [Thozetella sp. PMI_491]|nr:hypothetical protein GQ53DRAFT_684814 [Thozetella sp. PMI_491]
MTEAPTPAAPQRPPRPSLKQIYAQPVPLRTFPLPSFYPSNPVSLLHIAYVWLKQVLLPPPKEPSIRIQGQWNPETRSVHIVDPKSIRILWENGFWGKGNLSRSEPNWRKREQVRRGVIQASVSEEFTVARREDRQRLKWLRAKAEQEEIERTKALELKAPVGPLELLALPNSATELRSLPRTGLAKMREALEAEKMNGGATETLEQTPARQEPAIAQNSTIAPGDDVVDREHLQLTREETFFLVFSLGVLTVIDGDRETVPKDQLLSLFRSHSYFPPRPWDQLSPSDPFLVHYVAFHHFRSLGWCVRPGIKFGVDWLLYLEGPVFNHGEFGVIVIPSFSDPRWPESSSSPDEYPAKSWHWLMGTVRVLSNVFKSLVLVYVDIPPPPVFDLILKENGLAAALRKYHVREVMVRRWSSNRNR